MRAATFLPTMALMAAIAVPQAAKADPFRPGIKDQIELGRRAADQVRREEKVLGDADPRVKEIRRIGNHLLNTIGQDERKAKPFEYTFDVIDSKDVNAFAFPGGPVFFYTGLLDRFTTEDQIAGVLAHEIVHARNQHWASAYADNQKRQLGITAILFLLGAGGTAFDVAAVADTLLFTLPYSRKHESESDKVGLDMMIQAGYNPLQMAEGFRILEKASKGKTEEWMSTHPDTGKRIKAIEDMAKAKGGPWPAATKRAANIPQGYKDPETDKSK